MSGQIIDASLVPAPKQRNTDDERQKPSRMARRCRCSRCRCSGIKAISASIAGTGSFAQVRSEEHTSELQSLMRISYAVFCLKKKKIITTLKPKATNAHQTKSSVNIH